MHRELLRIIDTPATLFYYFTTMPERDVLNGITECRFEPLHKGHVFMVKMALGLLEEEARTHEVDHMLHVIVCSHDGETIPGQERFKWAQQTFGGYENITVHSAHNALEHIPGYGDDYEGPGYQESWQFWGKVAMDMCGLGDTVDYVFGSEDYVEGIAEACDATAVKIDQDRSTLQISGTIMRNSPYNNWEHFPDAVKPFFAKKVCIIGAPYTGKAQLARSIAEHYKTTLVTDVSDAIYNPELRGSTREDLEAIASLHTIRANALLEQANKVIVSDSDALLTRLWYQTLFGEPPQRLKELSDAKRFDLYLLTDSNGVDYRPSHSFPEESSWHEFTDFIRQDLTEREWPFIELKDYSLPRRVTKAVVAIDELLWESGENGQIGWKFKG